MMNERWINCHKASPFFRSIEMIRGASPVLTGPKSPARLRQRFLVHLAFWREHQEGKNRSVRTRHGMKRSKSPVVLPRIPHRHLFGHPKRAIGTRLAENHANGGIIIELGRRLPVRTRPDHTPSDVFHTITSCVQHFLYRRRLRLRSHFSSASRSGSAEKWSFERSSHCLKAIVPHGHFVLAYGL